MCAALSFPGARWQTPVARRTVRRSNVRTRCRARCDCRLGVMQLKKRAGDAGQSRRMQESDVVGHAPPPASSCLAGQHEVAPLLTSAYWQGEVPQNVERLGHSLWASSVKHSVEPLTRPLRRRWLGSGQNTCHVSASRAAAASIDHRSIGAGTVCASTEGVRCAALAPPCTKWVDLSGPTHSVTPSTFAAPLTGRTRCRAR